MTEENKNSIIIIEDNQELVEPLAEVFRTEGFEVLTALNGEEGLQKTLDEKPDVILLDIILPGMDGFSFLEQLRGEGDYGNDVPVIVLTNLDDAETVGSAMKYGVHDFLLKSDWQIDDVLKKVREKLAVTSSDAEDDPSEE